VLLLEKQAELGGTTGIAVGSFTANRTFLQDRAGIEDSLEAHVQDAGRFAKPEVEARNNAELRRFFLSHTAETFDWLGSMGLHFHGPSPEPPNRVARMHNVVPGAKAYIAALQARFAACGGAVLCRARVIELLRNESDVTGVKVEVDDSPQEFHARRGVVLAAGDYANSSEIVTRFKGQEFADIEGINPRACGDGHLLAEHVGAQLVNMDVTYGPELRFVAPRKKAFMQLLPTRGPLAGLIGKCVRYVPQPLINLLIKRLLVTWQHPEDALFDDGAILVNRDGRRFCDETVWPAREIAIARQPEKICYIVLDERLIERYSRWPHFISTAPEIAYAYVDDYVRLRADVTVRAKTLSNVARFAEIPESQLQSTVDAFNGSIARGTDDEFGRNDSRSPLQGGDWVLLGPAKAYFTTTEGGTAIDRQFRVLDRDDQPITGLYAIGQNGLGGQILWGHGLHIAWAMTSGRLVGKLLAEKSHDKTE